GPGATTRAPAAAGASTRNAALARPKNLYRAAGLSNWRCSGSRSRPALLVCEAAASGGRIRRPDKAAGCSGKTENKLKKRAAIGSGVGAAQRQLQPHARRG